MIKGINKSTLSLVASTWFSTIFFVISYAVILSYILKTQDRQLLVPQAILASGVVLGGVTGYYLGKFINNSQGWAEPSFSTEIKSVSVGIVLSGVMGLSVFLSLSRMY